MGKIRSTLDIVMEKTKNLSMTQDDRKNIRHRELADQARAMVQKYLDAKASLQEMGSELGSLGDERAELSALLKRDFLEHIQIDGDNHRVLDALESLWGIGRDEVAEHIQSSRSRLDEEMAHQLSALRSDLEARGIGGGAVIPNIARSRVWRDTLVQAQQGLADELSAIL
jgi:hypothetical protein